MAAVLANLRPELPDVEDWLQPPDVDDGDEEDDDDEVEEEEVAARPGAVDLPADAVQSAVGAAHEREWSPRPAPVLPDPLASYGNPYAAFGILLGALAMAQVVSWRFLDQLLAILWAVHNATGGGLFHADAVPWLPRTSKHVRTQHRGAYEHANRQRPPATLLADRRPRA